MASDPLAKVDSATMALDGIRIGGGHVLLLAHQRLNEIRDALTQGRFDQAAEAATVLVGKIGQLAQAQVTLGLLADNNLVRVGDLRVGMVVPGVGPITEVGPCPGCGRENCGQVAFTVGGTEMVMEAHIEMIVEAE